jgi:hypothetical protein
MEELERMLRADMEQKTVNRTNTNESGELQEENGAVISA